MTQISRWLVAIVGGDGDAAYEALAQHFTEKERTDLTYVIGTINMWNRFSVGFQCHPE